MTFNKEKLFESFIAIVVFGFFGFLIFAIFYASVFVLDDSEKVFQKSVLAQYEDRMEEQGIKNILIKKNGAATCILTVSIEINEIIVQDSLIMGHSFNPHHCHPGFTKINKHPQLFGSPRYRAEIDPELISAEEEVFDLNAYKKMMIRSKVVFSHVFELSEKIKADFEDIRNNI